VSADRGLGDPLPSGRHAEDDRRGRRRREAGGDSLAQGVPGLRPHQRHEGRLAALAERIGHFFEHYKDLEKGKWVKVEGWVGAEEAKAEILAGIARYKAEHGSKA
jgi:Inorganic pyrophosphatase